MPITPKRTKVNLGQLDENSVNSDIVTDGSITKNDINIDIPGKALITKIIAGNNINISSTGADPGTGEVTVNVSNVDSQFNVHDNDTSIGRFDTLNYKDSNDIEYQLVDIGSGTVNVTPIIKNTGVIAGTYTKLTVNNKGQITTAENPTTIDGYGITDAIKKTDNLIPFNDAILTTKNIDIPIIDSTVIDSYNKTLYRSCKYLIQISNDNEFQISEIIVTHNGSSAFFSELDTVVTSDNLGLFDVNVVDQNIQLNITTFSDNIKIKLLTTLFSV